LAEYGHQKRAQSADSAGVKREVGGAIQYKGSTPNEGSYAKKSSIKNECKHQSGVRIRSEPGRGVREKFSGRKIGIQGEGNMSSHGTANNRAEIRKEKGPRTPSLNP